ncbi:aminotransferase, class V [Candidatus Magnetomorum sp. HK-1]|nr:aminotransferase, class V [Candidatus Magnetomorum sp. HK-1]
MEDLNEYRKYFPVTNNLTFLNHASISPISSLVYDTINNFFKERLNYSCFDYTKWTDRVITIRAEVGEFIGAKANEISFLSNTSHGLNIIANGINWKKGDNIVVVYPDFPSNIYVWQNISIIMNGDVEIRFVKREQSGYIDLNMIKSCICKNTKLLSITSVDYMSGFNANLKDIGEFCKKQKILLCVDAGQSIGVIPIDVHELNIDFLVFCTYKWLSGPLGFGVLYVNDCIIDDIKPVFVGWKSVINEELFELNFKLQQDSCKFEYGVLSFSNVFGIKSALDLVKEIGIQRIQNKIFHLNEILRDELSNRDQKIISSFNHVERSGIIVVKPNFNDLDDFKSYFHNNKISITVRHGLIRISPSYYNNIEDIKRFLNVFDDFCYHR